MNLSRVAAKQLTSSDLTLFAVHYRRPGQRSKQKGINLNSDVFVDLFYPGLRDRFAELHFALRIIGPGSAEPHLVSRKALRTESAKNWRLNGEIVTDPSDDPERYSPLNEGDFAIIAFEGADTPEVVTLVLVSRSKDELLHAAIQRDVSFVGRKTMKPLTDLQIRNFFSETTSAYPQNHPFEALLSPETVEEALFGTSDTQTRTATSDGRGATISHESIKRQAASAAQTGQLGEEVFERWLLATGHLEDDYEWVSLTHARACFDFEVIRSKWGDSDENVFVDVKATTGPHESPFHMSMAEVRWAAAHSNYRICRVSALSTASAEIRVLVGVHELCQQIVNDVEQHIPDGVRVDSFEVDPKRLRIVATDRLVISDDE